MQENTMQFTNEIYQNDSGSEEYYYKKNQPYFEFEVNQEKQLIGLDQILLCIAVAEKVNEIPPIGMSFWQYLEQNFGINYFDIDVQLD